MSPRLNKMKHQENIVRKKRPEIAINIPEIEGKYRVLEQIGQGAFSVVYRAVTCDGDESIALKRIISTTSPARMLSEAKYLQTLDGAQNVVELLNVCFHDGNLTLVLPHFKHDYFRETYATMSVSEVAVYMSTLLGALAHVHEHKIIHRDVKPANFLYSRASRRGMLIDFGLAQSVIDVPVMNSRKDHILAERAGTRGFRAPEVLLCYAQQTCAIDLWSVGVILLSFLTHRYPFFSAPDDVTALAEIAVLVGTGERMQNALDHCDRNVVWPEQIEVQSLKENVKSKIAASSVSVFPDAAYQLLNGLLEPDPIARISATEALEMVVRDIDNGTTGWAGFRL